MGFILYFAILFTLPFGFLANEMGTLIGLGLFSLILVYLYFSGKEKLVKRLRLKKLYPADVPGLYSALSNYAKRLELPLPEVYLIHTPGLNVGSFSLSKKECVLFFSEGAIKTLKRQEISALCARSLVEFKSPDLKNRSWLTQFLLLLERPTTMDFVQNRSHTRRFYPFGVFIRQLILYPLCWIPLQLIGIRQNTRELDEISVSLTGERRALSEAYRKLEAQRERAPVFVPFAFHSLFLISPESIDPLAKVFVRSDSLNPRIYHLEGRLPL